MEFNVNSQYWRLSLCNTTILTEFTLKNQSQPLQKVKTPLYLRHIFKAISTAVIMARSSRG